MSEEQIDAAFRVVGTFTDLKSYWLRGHAEGTSQLAEAAAWRLGLPKDEVATVRRAALALDLGRVAVSNAIWEKPSPLGSDRLGASASAPLLHRALIRPLTRARVGR